MTPKQERKRCRIRFAAYDYSFVSTDIDEVARVVNISPTRLLRSMSRKSWQTETLEIWSQGHRVGDLKLAEKK